MKPDMAFASISVSVWATLTWLVAMFPQPGLKSSVACWLISLVCLGLTFSDDELALGASRYVTAFLMVLAIVVTPITLYRILVPFLVFPELALVAKAAPIVTVVVIFSVVVSQ